VESVLSQAREREREYDWLGAAESYGEALGLVPEQDFLRMGEIYERLGYAFYRLAMQGESREEFRDRMRQAIVNYEKAKEFFARLSEAGKTPRILRCDAMIAFIGHWLTSEVPEKKRLLDECWRLTKESLKAFEEADDALEYGKTYNQLSSSTVFAFTFESDFQVREKMMKEATECGERAIILLSTSEDTHELARAYAKTVVCLGVFAYYFLDVDEKEKYYQKGLGYWQKANELSEETAMLESLYPVFGGQILFGLEGTDEVFTNLKKALEYARKTNDKFFVGCALDWLTYHTAWKTQATENPDEKVELGKRFMQCAEDAKHQFSQISFVSPRADYAWIETPHAQYYAYLAGPETDLGKRGELFEKAMRTVPDLLKRAEDSGYPEVMIYAHLTVSLVLLNMAKIETNFEEKKRLLEEALSHSDKFVRITEQLEPFLYWNCGMGKGQISSIESELSDLAKDSETKKTMLQEAVLNRENSLKLALKELSYYRRRGSIPSLFGVLGSWQSEYGNLLNRLYVLTNNKEHLKKAIEAFEEAAESYQKLNLVSRVAECYWKAAQACDNLDEHSKSAESFETASNYYQSAAEKIPQLKNFYQDHALYMQAWNEIERARYHHKRQEYGLAEEHFEKAANLHKSLKQWNYLTPNYAAWAQVENAEDLSRKEQSEEAIKAFEQAANLFKETKESLQTQLDKIESVDEKQMATSIVKATDLRHEYCMARIGLEEARILDKKGDHYSSSEKYGSAAETFEKMNQASESEQERREIGFIINLSRAWQRMTCAEAEASPKSYLEASELFEQAKDFSPNEKTKMLVLGHSRFCRALEAGTRFADTRDPTMHAMAVQHLASAANYYTKADFPNASEYAKATKLLFDAYLHMDNAEKENDPEKKAKLYAMAEKVLQTSAGSYTKAEHPEKMEQVLKLLEKVKEERELATSLTEVLHAPSIISTTKAFTTPGPTHEEAVGSERFEHADIQANVITRQKTLKVGENLDLEIELVNAGKGPAILIKLAEVIPEGFELAEKPEIYRVEDNYLNMKGKRLDPLKTEEVKLVLKPKVQGTFPLKPRILYLDENGKYKTHEPEPINITVKELGIKGWLKGER
jgi:tetratricopeptide (TPR) repeat protein